MSSDPGPVFLERRSYRRRRVIDAAKLLPILGVVLFCIPLLWRMPGDEGARTSSVMVYLFVVWAALSVLSALISWRLGGEMPAPTSDSGDG